MNISISINGEKDVQKYLRAGANKMPRAMRGTMMTILELAHDEIVQVTPEGYPGSPDKMIESYEDEILKDGDDVVGRLFSAAPEGKTFALELGRSAGSKPPPVMALLPWVQWKMGGDIGVAFVVARAIGERGTDGHGMFEHTRAVIEEPAVERYEKMLDLLFP